MPYLQNLSHLRTHILEFHLFHNLHLLTYKLIQARIELQEEKGCNRLVVTYQDGQDLYLQFEPGKRCKFDVAVVGNFFRW